MWFTINTINLIQDIAWSNIQLTVYEYLPQWYKYHVYLQSGMHGWEVTIRVLMQLMQNIKNWKYTDIWFTIVPLANPLARNQIVYYATLWKFSFIDWKDPNRSFPWQNNWSYAQRLAYTLSQISSNCDTIIDLHTSRDSIPFAIFHWEDLNLIQSLWMEYNHIVTAAEYMDSLTWYMHSQGKVAFTMECWSHDEYDEEKINDVVESLDGYFLWFPQNSKSSRRSDQSIFDSLTKVLSPVSWFVQYTVSPWDRFVKWDIIAEITKIDNVIESYKVCAPSSGILLKRKKSNIVRVWDEIFQFIQQR